MAPDYFFTTHFFFYRESCISKALIHLTCANFTLLRKLSTMSDQFGRGDTYEGLYNGNESFLNRDFRRYHRDRPFKGQSDSQYGPASSVENRNSKSQMHTNYTESNNMNLWVSDLVTNDQEFYTAASELLSTIRPKYQTSSSTNDVEKLHSQILQLKYNFSIEQLKMFKRALEIRFKCLPLFPEPHENQLTSLIRRCERHLSQSLQILLQANEYMVDDEVRDIINEELRHQQPQRDRSMYETRDDRHDQRINGGERNSDSNTHSTSFQDGNDFTSHIVWDDKGDNPTRENDDQVWKEQTFKRESHSERSSPMHKSNRNHRRSSQSRAPKGSETLLDDDVERSFLNVEDQIYSFELSNISQSFVTDDLKEETDSIATSYALAKKASSASKPKNPRSSAQTIRYAKVKAPETLPESFMFEARIDDEIFMAVVVSISQFSFIIITNLLTMSFHFKAKEGS